MQPQEQPDKSILESIIQRVSVKQLIRETSTWQKLTYSVLPSCIRPEKTAHIVDMTEKYVSQKFDMIKLLEVIFNLEKLLKLTLTKNQRLLFNLLPWDYDTSVKVVHTIEGKIDMLKDSQDAVRKLQNQESLTLLDAKLLQVLGFLSDVEFS